MEIFHLPKPGLPLAVSFQLRGFQKLNTGDGSIDIKNLGVGKKLIKPTSRSP
jgi:hypothetical protein